MPISAELSPAVVSATHLDQVHEINLEQLDDEFRLQRLVFKAARKAFDEMRGRFTGGRDYLVFQLIRLVEQFLESNSLHIPTEYHRVSQKPILYRFDMAEQGYYLHSELLNC